MLSWMRHPSGRPVLPRLALIAFAATAVMACDDDPTEPDTFTFEGELAGAGEFDEVSGLAEVIATTSSFVAGVEIADGPEDAVFAWTLMEGTCADPGDAVGAAASYPELEVDAEGEAAAQANIAASLDEEEDYIVVVMDESGDEPVTVACGALEPN
jgi:hypothetical protein